MDAAPDPDESYLVSRLLYEAIEEQRRAFQMVAEEHGLTPAQARSILRLHEPTAMRALAEHLACDPSNVTGIADRLRVRGLVEPSPGSDRRIKLLALTPKGRKLREAIQRELAEQTPSMTRLTPAERKQLVALLGKLSGSARSNGRAS